MATRKLSPSARILKCSRIFTLPPPLARPSFEYSETATTDYPIRAAVQTTESAKGRGDWGLKRALPLKSTAKKQEPHLYIQNLDTIDHVIDFSSATGHTRTLEKFQAFDLSISRQAVDTTGALQNVFEKKYDATDGSTLQNVEDRWKFRGPWIAGQTHGEFRHFVEKKVRRRKDEFREYLKSILSAEQAQQVRQELFEQGADPVKLDRLADEGMEVSEAEVDRFIKALRRNREKLRKHVENFLDLPRDQIAYRVRGEKATAEQGPLPSHPSAGLSYLRSHAHADNHCLYGPQENAVCREARVLIPQSPPFGKKRPSAVLGLDGFVVQDHQKSATTHRSLQDPTSKFDPGRPAGYKVPVEIGSATLSPQGRVRIVVRRALRNPIMGVGTGLFPSNNEAYRGRPIQQSPSETDQGRQIEGVSKIQPAIPFSKGASFQDALRGLTPRPASTAAQASPSR